MSQQAQPCYARKLANAALRYAPALLFAKAPQQKKRSMARTKALERSSLRLLALRSAGPQARAAAQRHVRHEEQE